MLKHFDFECSACSQVFAAFVEGSEGQPDLCPNCATPGPYKKLPSTFASPQAIIVSYPGSKRLKAGYVHTHARPAEKKESQVSMYMPGKSGD